MTPLQRRVTVPTAGARRRRGVTVGAIVVVLIAAGTAAAYRYRALLRPAAPAPTAPTHVALSPVVAGPLTSQRQVSGIVQYLSDYAYAASASDYPVVDEAQGVITALPALGAIVSQGQSLYSVAGGPVILLYGTVPAYRSLSVGLTGPDVQELNADLVALGDATAAELSPASDQFTAATATALERMEARAGLPATGRLPLGEALFLPAAVRVAAVEPSLGASVSAGQTVLQTTSSAEEVVAEVDPSQAAELKAGQPATITFADGTTAPGTISHVANVATSSGSGSGGGGGSPTVEVDIAPTSPTALNGLDNASVTVSVITASVAQALAVPVTALLAQAGGGYAVEVVDAAGSSHLVPVTLGIFDDAAGLVQVTGTGLVGGQQVAVAGT